MKFLRHEEFKEGCEAACNGRYDGMWSKDMVGYGSEDNHFVVELTYNYPIKSYIMGNDFKGITIFSKTAVANVHANNWPILHKENNLIKIACPDGYIFYVYDQDVDSDPVQMWTLSVTDLKRSIAYWNGLLGMAVVESKENYATLSYSNGPNKHFLRLEEISGKFDRGTYFGRTAFACPLEQILPLQEKILAANQKVLVPYVRLDTPGKATVSVVILADPDGHEICFVEDEGFRQLSKIDPCADTLLDEAILNDRSRNADGN